MYITIKQIIIITIMQWMNMKQMNISLILQILPSFQNNCMEMDLEIVFIIITLFTLMLACLFIDYWLGLCSLIEDSFLDESS